MFGFKIFKTQIEFTEIQISPILIIIFVKDILRDLMGIKNLITPNGIIKVAKRSVFINKIKKQTVPLKFSVRVFTFFLQILFFSTFVLVPQQYVFF
jgi:hypothetical protein